ncbi:MAG: Tfx family DNA-binding protein [Haloarculaceae archaeon]
MAGNTLILARCADSGVSGEDTAVDADAILETVGFDADESVLTRRQAEVLAYRDRGLTQGAIAERFGTSRANVASIEASARENVARARETISFVNALEAPVQISVTAGTDLYDVPQRVFDACDEADIKVSYTAPELIARINESGGDAVVGREVRHDVVVSVTSEGSVRVRRRRE